MRKPSTTEQEYIYAILEEQKETNRLLRQLICEKPKEKPDYENMKRHEIMKLINELPDKPKGWTKLPNDKLMELLK